MHILRRGSLGSSPFLFLSLARVHLLYVTNAGEFGIRLGRSEPQTRPFSRGSYSGYYKPAPSVQKSDKN